MRRMIAVVGVITVGCGQIGSPDDGGALDAITESAADVQADDMIAPDANGYDASWYDGGVAEPCHPFNTPCSEPDYIVYGCCNTLQHCFQSEWQAIPDYGFPCP